MSQAFKKANLKSKKSRKRSAPNLSEPESSLDEEWYTFKLNSLGDNSLTELGDKVNQAIKKSRLVKLSLELVAKIISKKSKKNIAKGKETKIEDEREIL